MISRISGKDIKVNNIAGPTGVAGRNSDNTLIKQKIDWAPSQGLEVGIKKTYEWIKKMVEKL